MFHPASLVSPKTHSKALLQLVGVGMTQNFIDYLVSRIAATVDFALSRPQSFRRPSSSLTKFTAFVTSTLSRAEVTTSTVLASLVYVERARPHLHIALEEWALERVFLGALIVASKYTNDSTLKNVHWALCTGVFGKRDIGRIEREFLDVLDFELSISERDILAHYEPVMAATALPSSSSLFRPVVKLPPKSSPAPVRPSRVPAVRLPRPSPVPRPVPDLVDTDEEEDGYSDESSDLSSSPRTPASPQRPSSLHKPTSSASSFGTILKSFPLPTHHSHLAARHQYPSAMIVDA